MVHWISRRCHSRTIPLATCFPGPPAATWKRRHVFRRIEPGPDQPCLRRGPAGYGGYSVDPAFTVYGLLLCSHYRRHRGLGSFSIPSATANQERPHPAGHTCRLHCARLCRRRDRPARLCLFVGLRRPRWNSYWRTLLVRRPARRAPATVQRLKAATTEEASFQIQVHAGAGRPKPGGRRYSGSICRRARTSSITAKGMIAIRPTKLRHF